MMKFSSTMTIQYDTIFSPFTAAQYPEALDWLRDSGFDAAEVCISHYRDLDVAGFKASLPHRFYDRRYGRVDGAPLLAHWFFTLEAAVCLVDYMYCHVCVSSSMSF